MIGFSGRFLLTTTQSESARSIDSPRDGNGVGVGVGVGVTDGVADAVGVGVAVGLGVSAYAEVPGILINEAKIAEIIHHRA